MANRRDFHRAKRTKENLSFLFARLFFSPGTIYPRPEIESIIGDKTFQCARSLRTKYLHRSTTKERECFPHPPFRPPSIIRPDETRRDETKFFRFSLIIIITFPARLRLEFICERKTRRSHRGVHWKSTDFGACQLEFPYSISPWQRCLANEIRRWRRTLFLALLTNLSPLIRIERRC